MNERRFLLAMLIAIALGMLAGFVLGKRAEVFGWIGEMFLTMLKMLIVPLVVASVVSGIANLGDPRTFGRLGLLTFGYYLTTTFIAVSLGLFVANLIAPGVGAHWEPASGKVPHPKEVGITDLILSLVHPNIVAAAAEMKLLPLIVFAIVFGLALARLGEQGRPAVAFFEAINEAMMTIVHWIMYLAPLGVFALIAARLGHAGGGEAFLQQLASLGKYVLAVLLGLLLHAGVLLALLALVARRAPSEYLGHIGAALATAFSTASSSATLPLTMDGVKAAGVDARARRFVLPVGATVNMDGTALYEAVAALFIAQAYGVDLSFSQQLLVLLTATLAAIGAAGIPEAGLVTMVIVLSSVGLPIEGIGLILAVDWFLDRCRTTINVLGDATGAAVVSRLLGNSSSETKRRGHAGK